jgi:hypothetical protein
MFVLLFCVVLSCVGTGRPPVQGVLPRVEEQGSETSIMDGLGCLRTAEPQGQKEQKKGLNFRTIAACLI